VLEVLGIDEEDPATPLCAIIASLLKRKTPPAATLALLGLGSGGGDEKQQPYQGDSTNASHEAANSSSNGGGMQTNNRASIKAAEGASMYAAASVAWSQLTVSVREGKNTHIRQPHMR